MDWRGIVDELGGIARNTLEGLAEGAQEDLQAYAQKIASQTVVAARLRRDDLYDELMEHLGLLAEKQRIRLVDGAELALQEAMAIAFRLLRRLGGM